MDTFDNGFAVEEWPSAVAVGRVGGGFFGKGHIGVIESPEFFKVGHNRPVIDDFLDVPL